MTVRIIPRTASGSGSIPTVAAAWICGGSDRQEQMTADSRVNWFPHPAPDGRSVLYLGYEPGTEGHPRDCEVELRLVDMVDGSVRTLLALFGGQGTINVPCWSPDGGRFAFVRYRRNGA